MTRALVLGATGFIGGQIARAAIEHGWPVRGLRRRPEAVGAIGPPVNVEWVEGDLWEVDTLRAAMDGCEIVFQAVYSALNLEFL